MRVQVLRAWAWERPCTIGRVPPRTRTRRDAERGRGSRPPRREIFRGPTTKAAWGAWFGQITCAMSAVLSPLGLADMPPTTAGEAGSHLIPDRVPTGYTVDAKPVGEGAHNAAYKATHPGIQGEVLLRINTDVAETEEEQQVKEREIAGEVARSIEFATLGVAPHVYDFGYCPSTPTAEGYYWQVLELYDESLHAYLVRRGTRACAETHRLEELVLAKLSLMVQAGSFCYDIHPRNVVVKTARVRDRDCTESAVTRVALIDFDDSFCIRKSRINPPPSNDLPHHRHHRPTRSGKHHEHEHEHRRPRSSRRGGSHEHQTRHHEHQPRHPRSSHRGGSHEQGGAGRQYHVSLNNLLVCALVVFGSNSKEQCGVPLFRAKVLGLLRGDRTYAIAGGGPVDMHEVLRFLGTSTAQGGVSTLGMLRHWNPRYGGGATPEQFVEHVLGPKHAATARRPRT